MARTPPASKGEQRGFDQILLELEGVVQRLEQGEIPLEEALEAFERGVILTREGERILSEAERRVEVLLKSGSGEQELAPLPGAPAGSDE